MEVIYLFIFFVRSSWGCHFVEWCYVASRGASSGILLMWDRRATKMLGNKILMPKTREKRKNKKNME
jgi:hypothetical protein